MKQLSIFVENEIGSVGKVTTVLKNNGINLKAISAFDSPAFSILRIVVDQTDKAKQLLLAAGFAVKQTDVLAVELQDKPGDLDNVLGIMAQNRLNINYIYSFVIRGGNAPLMVMNVNDMEKAIKVLKENGVNVEE